ncbi:MAG: SDR family oxidoreductase, partial [Parvularculaceae bacterium]|nr:SDR family oxidoreductase [Parvularculaceae bacterium]
SPLPLASFRNVDLRDRKSIDAGVASLKGKIDALFNCAGLPQTFPPLDVMKVNFIGTRHLTERVLPLMQGKGAVASVSSTGGLGWSRRVPMTMQLLGASGFEAALAWCESNLETVREGYSFSKEAVIVWTMVSGVSLIKKGVRINCTLPSPTQTPMMAQFESATPLSVIEAATQPIGRRSTPREQAEGLVYLNSDLASFVNGVVLPVDAGFMGGVSTGTIDISAMMGGRR